MNKINIQIQNVLEKKAQNKYIEERLYDIREKLEKLKIKEEAYLLRSEKELEDVRKLESLGVKALFSKVIGNHHQQLEKERQEYLLAVVKHKSIQEEIVVLGFEESLLAKRLLQPELIDKELNQLIKKKEFTLKSYDTEFSKELFSREGTLGRLKLIKQKLLRIERNAKQSTLILIQIADKLHEVKDWPPSGKAKYASFIKKKYIDKARSKVVEAKVKLDEFSKNFSLLFKEETFEYDMSGFESFLDRFYENLITDYIVASQLEKTLGDVEKTITDLSNVEIEIGEKIEKQDLLIQSTQEELNQYVLKYGTAE